MPDVIILMLDVRSLAQWLSGSLVAPAAYAAFDCLSGFLLPVLRSLSRFYACLQANKDQGCQ